MNSSNKSTDDSAGGSTETAREQPFVAEGGVPYVPAGNRDPLRALDDLMCVIEALSPTWPPREPMKEGKYWRL